ncbi:hypothetical protein [Pseudomonas citronellolis]|uniref:hypothetical protein n=1 Tax=Pseudomonas citronellolis TaxID=53408 RepID=UPI0023E3A8DD|nr:hypothetical protein [Pseudomonas citronellolis]MDF3932206.1 hypothetical protein [Pseudomonas citronellolis]
MRQRISYPNPFKSQFVQECIKPGASVAGGALSHGSDANVVRKWLPLHCDQPATTLDQFMALQFELDEANANYAAGLQSGMSISLVCTGRSDVAKTPMSKDCLSDTR